MVAPKISRLGCMRTTDIQYPRDPAPLRSSTSPDPVPPRSYPVLDVCGPRISSILGIQTPHIQYLLDPIPSWMYAVHRYPVSSVSRHLISRILSRLGCMRTIPDLIPRSRVLTSQAARSQGPDLISSSFGCWYWWIFLDSLAMVE